MKQHEFLQGTYILRISYYKDDELEVYYSFPVFCQTYDFYKEYKDRIVKAVCGDVAPLSVSDAMQSLDDTGWEPI